MEYNIFYSWQSDIDNKKNFKQRQSIKKAIEKAKTKIESLTGITIYIDEATRDKSGAINIVESIQQKIKQCDIFIADVSIINKGAKNRKTSNPNVMFELGLATESVTWNGIILLLNEYTGYFDDLPFDIKTRRAIRFLLKDASKSKELVNILSQDLSIAIQTCLRNEPKLRLKEITNALINSEWKAFNFIDGKIDNSQVKGIVNIQQIHNHIFSFHFESYENYSRHENGDWQARFFINETTLTTAQLAFTSNVDFGLKTIMFPLDRLYNQLFLIGEKPIYGNQILIKKSES